MPSFKVLKGTQPASVERFAFEPLETELRGDTSLDKSCPTAPAPPTAEGSPSSDPLDNLEQMVRQRLLEAQRRAEELEREAYQKGYEQGQKDGYAFGSSSIEKIRERLETLADAFEHIPSQVLRDYRHWLIEAALTLSRHLLTAAVSLNPSAVETLVDQILDHMDRSHTVTVVLHPKDRDLLQKHGMLQRWLSAPADGGGPVRVAVDPQMSRGGCRVYSDLQEIDAQVETRVKNLREALFSNELPT